MSNGNPFALKPSIGEGFSKAMSGLGGILAQSRENAKMEEAKEEVSNAVQSGDPTAVMGVVTKYPQLAQSAKAAYGIANQQTSQLTRELTSQLLYESDDEAAADLIDSYLPKIMEMGGKPMNLAMAAKGLRDGTQDLNQVKGAAMLLNPDMAKQYRDSVAKGQDKFKMGTGKMSGFVFNENTGEYSIDPDIKAAMDAEKSELASKEGMLGGKDIAGINDKVTALTKDVRFIANAASSLEALKDNPSPAAKLAAVFKFMKANDPTSVVREGEQGQVYAAEGAAKQLAGKINALLGEGALTDTGFADLVNTAKIMTNSAIDSANAEVGGYLDVLSDKMPARDVARMQARVPEYLELESAKTVPDAPDAAVAHLRDNPDLAPQFKAKYGYLPEGM
jgi:hypothetical protein